MHFRCKSNKITDKSFNIGTKDVQVASQYEYLGLLLTEHLDYTMIAKHVFKSANRALGLVISKFNALVGLPYNTFTKLYDAVVLSTISYGVAICGGQELLVYKCHTELSCKIFMGVEPYTPNAARIGDVGWSSTDVKEWNSVLNHWYRLKYMDESHIQIGG